MGKLLEARVLGPFDVRWSDGTAVSLSVRKAQGLITYLAVEGRATRDTVANLFWGDRNDDRARHNVRQVLSKIRSTCGSVISTDGDFLQLDPEHISVDAKQFLALTRADERNDSERSRVPGLVAGCP
jgi:DNA-binding SARP family transcriptional activator